MFPDMNNPMAGAPPSPAASRIPSPMGGSGLKPGADNPPPGGEKEAIEDQLVGLLTQAKKMAEANNLDWSSIMDKVGGSAVSSSRTVPRPPNLTGMMG